jgi:hypothetical protein
MALPFLVRLRLQISWVEKTRAKPTTIFVLKAYHFNIAHKLLRGLPSAIQHPCPRFTKVFLVRAGRPGLSSEKEGLAYVKSRTESLP